MTIEKYVNKIIRKMKCSRSRCLEIRQQLLSDIGAARENGESPADIMRRMGSADEVAREFNQNMPAGERKVYRRNKILKIVITVAVIIAVAAGIIYRMLPKGVEMGTSGVFEQNTVTEQAEWVIEKLDENDFDVLIEASDAAMQQVLTQETIDDARASIGDDWGDFRSYGQTYMSELKQNGKTFAAVQMTVAYENVSVTYTILFDEDMKLSGLYMK